MDMTIAAKKYLIFSITNAVTKDNRPYIRMVLSDAEGGSINAIMFDCNKLKFTPEKGQVAEVTGTLQQYNGVAQLKVTDMAKVENADVTEFLPKSEKDFNAMVEELKDVLNKNIKSDYFKKLAELFLGDEVLFGEFVVRPAAKSVHHAYIHGLLEHTLSMMKLCSLVASYYGSGINKELLVMGALFHDIGKIYEINSDSAFDYTDEGKLLGHLILGLEVVNKYTSQIENFPNQARVLLLHLIASHHGYLEFGSPKRPKTKEALILHFVDNMDAKLATLDYIFNKECIAEGGWSSYDKHLERQLYNHGFFGDQE